MHAQWRQGFQGKGAERYGTGELYVGDVKCGQREGRGLYNYTDGQLMATRWRANEPVGEGIQWTPDRQVAVRLLDGRPVEVIPHERAAAIARELGVPSADRFHPSLPSTWIAAGLGEMNVGRPRKAAVDQGKLASSVSQASLSSGGAAQNPGASAAPSQGDLLLAAKARRPPRSASSPRLASPRSPAKKDAVRI